MRAVRKDIYIYYVTSTSAAMTDSASVWAV